MEVVTFTPATSGGVEGDRQRSGVYRYRSVPDLAIYGTTERSFVAQRLTRPLSERLVADSAGTD